MTNKIKILFKVLILFSFIFTTIIAQPSNKTIAVVRKAINLVQKKAPETDWSKAGSGTLLFSQDKLRTGIKSVAVIKFNDKSIFRLLENSELILLGERTPRRISNNIKILRGIFGFDIIKQQNEQYTFDSPTSVASIRGTKGTFSHQNEMDILLLIEGVVNLKNIVSGKEIDVNGGDICFSYSDGRLELRKASVDELMGAEESLSIGEVQKENELKLELQNKDGNKKELKIKYKE